MNSPFPEVTSEPQSVQADQRVAHAQEELELPAPSSVSRHRLRVAIAAFSLANLCFVHAWFASYSDRDFGYFNKLPVSSTTLLALLCNLVLLTLFFWLATQWMQRRKSRFVVAACHVLSLAPLLIPLDFIRIQFFQIADHQVIEFVRRPLTLLALTALGAMAVNWHQQMAKALTAFLVIVSPLALLTVSKATLLLIGIGSIAQDAGKEPLLAPLLSATNNTRVVWIIFDEMDYKTAFESRSPGTRLPELDRLGRESFQAARAYPPAGSTLLSIPALTTGREVWMATPCSARELLLTTNENGQTTGWTRLPSVFADAREVGVNVGAVGWYHPYERLFSSVLSYCDWLPYPGLEPARGATFLQTMKREICSMAAPLNLRWLHMENYQSTLQSATHLVTNESYGLVFLHLPVPHKPGIYDAQQGQLTFMSVPGARGYQGNLVLADRTFGKLRGEMEQTGAWEKTWLIISSDHWWRKGTGNQGQIDYRIPFLVKAPKEITGVLFDEPFNTIITRDLIGAILKREVSTPNDIARWIRQHRIEPPRSYDWHSAED